MNKHRMTPFFALTKTPNLNVGESDDLETHLAEILAVEALSAAMAGSNEAPRSSWRTSVTKRLDGGALSFAAYRGKIAANPETGHPEADLTAERKLSLDEYRNLGLFDGLDRAMKEWEDDDCALGINFSRLHRIARLVENRAPEFMQGLRARIQEDLRANATYGELETAAERRSIRAEQERQRQHEEWLVEQEERRKAAQERAEKRHAEEMALKREIAAMFGKTYEDEFTLDNAVHIATNTSTRGYEKTFDAPMPEPYARHGPFRWVRVSGFDQKVYFDARGERIPEPS